MGGRFAAKEREKEWAGIREGKSRNANGMMKK
jgi:hypothetical protein